MLRKVLVLGLLCATLGLSGCGWCGSHPWFGWWNRRCCNPCPAPCGPTGIGPGQAVAVPAPGAYGAPPLPEAARFGPTPDAVVKPGYYAPVR